MNVRTYAEFKANNETPEILFWVGCAGSFDARAQKVTKAFAEILEKAGVSFAVLGDEEGCTGDPARRAGNEFIFQMSALQNIETLNMYGVEKIVATCPHCFNTLKNEYPALGGNYEVIHHTQFLNQLIDEGKIKLDKTAQKVTYHDSCYLGRVNGEYDAPRGIIGQLSNDIREMKRSRTNGLCCGAGGAQMWKEDEPGNKRINTERVEEALDTGAEVLLANCPFCITMMEDGIKEKEKQEEVMVYDLAEMIVNNMK
ncbi:MAG TPA: (Fe-S)-binding protein [Saprospiraceae bacterium]|nr:(Fe-S)-binding protein [Saprospiraceae bacterium]